MITFVTCLFDCHDGTEYKADNYYFARSLRTLYIDAPMVIFCDSHYVKKFKGIREALGYDKTLVIDMSIKDLMLFKYLDLVKKREGRVTREMSIVQGSKAELVLRVLKENPFNTTHFAWIDINQLSKHPHNTLNYFKPDVYEIIQQIVNNPHDKFAITVLGSWNTNAYKDLDKFYSTYPYIVAGGFFTTDLESGLFLLPKVLEVTEKHTKGGYLWSEESIYAEIIDEFEDKFTLLLGDYQDSFENYFTLKSNLGYISGRLLNGYKINNLQTRFFRILDEYKSRDNTQAFTKVYCELKQKFLT